MDLEVSAEFKRSGFGLEDEEDILRKCVTVCKKYSLSPSDIVSSWEVYYLNRQLAGTTVQSDEVDGFLEYLQNEQKEAIRGESNLHVYSNKDVELIVGVDEDDSGERTPGSSTDQKLTVSSELVDHHYSSIKGHHSCTIPINVDTPFSHRNEKLAVKFRICNLLVGENAISHDHGHQVSSNADKANSHMKCSFDFCGSEPKAGCRFMYDRTEDRFNALDTLIRQYGNALILSGLCEELSDPTIASQKKTSAVGMIFCDGEGHLNDKSIILQSSVEHSGGRRVRLDLSRVNQFSIFPGQIVGVEGHNPSGHCFIASRLIDSIPHDECVDGSLPPSKRQALTEDVVSTEMVAAHTELTMLIASGPFTTCDNLLFEPLIELLAHTRQMSPQLVILMGPFVDSEHPIIKKGIVDRSFNEIFHSEILRRLQDHVESSQSEALIILVPSTRDANHDYVFPQPPFDINLCAFKNQIISVTNPASFEANKAKISCCTVDILKQLSAEELSRNPSEGAPVDRMSRIASHILNQHRFYPLYPPSEDVPLDFSLAQEALQVNSVPDILVLPSDMKYFIKVLTIGDGGPTEEKKCVCINPGRLSRGEGGGTFARVIYRGSPDRMNASIVSI